MTEYSILAVRASGALGDLPGSLFERLLRSDSGMNEIPDYRFDSDYKNVINRGACLIPQSAEFWTNPLQNIMEIYVIPAIKGLLDTIDSAGVEIPRDRIALCIGTSVGTGHELARAARLKLPSPIRLGFGELLRIICSETGIVGPISILSTACTAGSTSVIRAIHYISSKRADLAICGGFDFFSELTHAGFNSLRAITPDLCRPFDIDRQGMILGDGVGFLAVARSDDKRFSKLPAIARIAGFALGSDNYHETSPQPTGKTQAALIRRAWIDAGRPPIGYVNAHGTATLANDEAEANAISIFAQEAEQGRILVSSIKGNIGHTLGAAGAVEAIVAALCLQRGRAPPNFGLQTPIEAAPNIVFLREAAILQEGAGAVSLSLAFGGHIAVLVMTPNSMER